VRKLAAFLLLSLTLLFPCAPALCADAGPVVISIPEGFDGPIRSEEEGGVTLAWVKRVPGREGGALLQVSYIDLGTSLDGMAPAQRGQGATHYLLEFISGIAEKRGNFAMGDVEAVSLAGLPGSRVRWTGTVGDSAGVGVMYCVLVGHSVVTLHAQDVGNTITPAMYSAIAAIEAVRVRKQ
jgi:hypothetical protein